MFLISGYPCNAQVEDTIPEGGFSPPKGSSGKSFPDTSTTIPVSRATEAQGSDHVPGLFFKLLLPSNPESVLPSGVPI